MSTSEILPLSELKPGARAKVVSFELDGSVKGRVMTDLL